MYRSTYCTTVDDVTSSQVHNDRLDAAVSILVLPSTSQQINQKGNGDSNKGKIKLKSSPSQ